MESLSGDAEGISVAGRDHMSEPRPSTIGSRSIGTKILVRTMAVSLLPLLVLSGVAFAGLRSLQASATDQVDESRRVLEDESVAATSQDQAASLAREVNATLLDRVHDVFGWTRTPVVTSDARAASQFAREEGLTGLSINLLEERFSDTRTTGIAPSSSAFLAEELEHNPEFREVFFTDANGFNAGLTAETSDFVQSDEEWWQEAWANGISVSDVEFDESANILAVDISVRIDDQVTGAPLGVMKAVLSTAFVQSIASARAETGTDYVVALADGQLIADTATSHEADRIMNPELAPEAAPAGLSEALAAVDTGFVAESETVSGFTRTSTHFVGADVNGFEGFDWVVVSNQPAEVAFAPLRGLEQLEDDIADSGSSLRNAILLTALLSLTAAVLMARILSRTIVDPIRRLTTAASEAADQGLPDAVERIDKDGTAVDEIDVPLVELDTGDELEHLAHSFNSVQDTALRLAAEQAVTRRNTADMFVNLGRRNNSLIKRQLRFIDTLERNEADPNTLDSLFKLDHLATRMRRNAESLLVLAGQRAPRRWTAPVKMSDVVQAALAEVEEYERADLSELGDGVLQGNVVADVAHILAELIENALNFSPPTTTVKVYGRSREDGYILSITDQGLGLSREEVDGANHRLTTEHDLSKVPSQHIGLFVVARLAKHHGITVELSQAVMGGTAATILLPAELTSGAAESLDGDLDTKTEPQTELDAEIDVDTEVDDEDTGGAGHESENVDDENDAKGDLEDDEDVSELVARSNDEAGAEGVNSRRGLDDPVVESVTIGETAFPRRRSGEPEDTPTADETSDPALAEFGFTRRGTQEDNAPTSALPDVAMVSKTDNAADETEAELIATQSRSQWSSFQQSKEAAETDPLDESE